MASNYDAIRRENIEEYGRSTRVLELLGSLYTDRTHFLYEILQNSEDAKASRVEFVLHEDRILVRHDGRSFEEKDVRGVCGVGVGTKAEDLTKIGKFGIGFKSVYQYTRSPEVHSGEEHFRIRDYVRPEGVQPQQLPEGCTTEFIFSFDNPSVPASQAYQEIQLGLEKLKADSLLFLRNIEEISYCTPVHGKRVFSRRTYSRGAKDLEARKVRLSGTEVNPHDWLVFDRPIEIPGSEAKVHVEIAFLLGNDIKTEKEFIQGVERNRSTLVVYFPTEKQTGLGFLVQGPYRTTPARDNVPVNNAWNKKLVDETADLLVKSLLSLKDSGLLTIEVFDALPIRSEDFPVDSMFRPFFDSVRAAFCNHPLLPAAGGGYTVAASARLGRGKELRSLLSGRQLQALRATSKPLRWLTGDITERMPVLYKYLTDILKIEAIDPESFANNLTVEFLSKQSDAWIILFYKFLLAQEFLWRPPTGRGFGKEGIIRRQPIVRLRDNRHVAPFNQQGLPNAFLPPPVRSTLPEVKKSLAADATAKEFLKRLGLGLPDTHDEVLTKILPKYMAAGPIKVTQADHLEDLGKIASAALKGNFEKTQEVIRYAAAVRCLRAENPATGTSTFCRPADVYWPSPELVDYFKENPQVLFLHPYLHPLKDFLIGTLRIRTTVNVKRREPDAQGNVTIFDRDSWHSRGAKGFDPDCSIDGLELALQGITPVKAQFIWNQILVPNRLACCVTGEVSEATRKDFSNARHATRWSSMGKLLGSASWLPTKDGKFSKPAGITYEDMQEGFERSEELLKALNFKPSARTASFDEMASRLGIEEQLLLWAKDNIEELRKAKEQHDKLRVEMATLENSGSNTFSLDDFRQEVAQVFSKNGYIVTDEPELMESPSPPNSERRKAKLREEIEGEMSIEPALKNRFSRVPQKEWERTDGGVRAFLLQEYQGRCQICNDGFLKKNGRPYFEGLYLVSRTAARWVNRPGNTLCLCASCCAKMQHGLVQAEDVVEQLLTLKTVSEGAVVQPSIEFTLCGQRRQLTFTDRHLLELHALLCDEHH